MVNIFENNLNTFDVNNNCNTIICDAAEIKNSNILTSLSPLQKSKIHLNVKINTDKDIENFIYLEQNGNYKSINIILHSNFNLSKTACKKLEILINVNTVFNYTEDKKLKGCSFKNYFLTNAVNKNTDTYLLPSDNCLYVLKNFSIKENNAITFNNTDILSNNIKFLSPDVIDFLKAKNYENIFLKINSDTVLEFKINLLYIIFERIDKYTNSISSSIENTLKFNITYNIILEDINNDYQNSLKTNTITTTNNFDNSYNDLYFLGYHFIIYQTLNILKINSKLILGNLLKTNNENYYVQINLDKYWFNLDIVWNHKNSENEEILKNDKNFFKTHSTDCKNIEKCTVSYKKYMFIRFIKNKIFILFNKDKRKVLQLPTPK